MTPTAHAAGLPAGDLTSAPHATRRPGLAADLDTTELTDGKHTIGAKNASGGTVEHTVTVNNAPVGAPALLPEDGTLPTLKLNRGSSVRRTPAARWVALTLTAAIVTISLYWFVDRVWGPAGPLGAA
ncbi:hypothetical protein ABZ723_08805 [Streptomyces sp. NPDC006700]|uniref:hypothetical protein n=1 Tax=unclassified Streptomyces TaxID=2593676 RepID=UPI0033CDD9B3